MKKIFMASIALTSLSLSIALFQMTSCKKVNGEVVKTYPIEGLYIGAYTVDGQDKTGEQYFSFIIKPDGTMINDSKGGPQQHINLGTWTLSGTTLSCSFVCVYGYSYNIGIKETSTATWDNTGKLVAGIWKNVAPLTGSGKFTMTRVN